MSFLVEPIDLQGEANDVGETKIRKVVSAEIVERDDGRYLIKAGLLENYFKVVYSIVRAAPNRKRLIKRPLRRHGCPVVVHLGDAG